MMKLSAVICSVALLPLISLGFQIDADDEARALLLAAEGFLGGLELAVGSRSHPHRQPPRRLRRAVVVLSTAELGTTPTAVSEAPGNEVSDVPKEETAAAVAESVAVEDKAEVGVEGEGDKGESTTEPTESPVFEQRKPFSAFKPGDLVDGIVVNIAQYGAFVDIGAVRNGLIHVSQLADHYVADPRDVVKEGDHVRVKVLSVEEDRQRIALSMLTESADLKTFDAYPPETWFKGTVVSLAPFGAFVNLAPGVDGLVHISQLAPEFVGNVNDVVTVGQDVDVRIVKIDFDKQQVALTMLKPGEEPARREPARREPRDFNEGVDEWYAANVPNSETWLTGTVEGTAPYGAFVSLAPGIRGLLHVSQISDNFVENVSDHLSEGEEVQVRVTNKDGRKLSLSMKPPGEEGGRGGGGGRRDRMEDDDMFLDDDY
ncbi:unnamed protein product [Vitrella brassicaformis CCMP3155]|uniref:S1 motif domain-containing protein n=2 Tax=Vitrella brassicaformis TaxID=1169539 RepID=A0A0G4FWL3_VITBC|nr:unnamed protein product [Vitrella brassicaformis CCMP3155]|eukprot:CEM19614.1 unnamed protein product [Vitrella brassicaformis CCMP3155]